MTRLHTLIAGLAMSASFLAAAKLPAPSPEEQQKAAERTQAQKDQVAREQEQLVRAQDRVVERYKREKPQEAQGASTAAGGISEPANVPRKSVEAPGTAGPHGGRNQSAEAHSAPAR